VNDTPNDVVLVPSVLTPPVALVSSEADMYLGLFIFAAFWAFFSAAVVALSAHDRSQKSAVRWAVSMAVASLVMAYFLGMLL
jgi:uncharacterized membrane protein YwaF